MGGFQREEVSSIDEDNYTYTEIFPSSSTDTKTGVVSYYFDDGSLSHIEQLSGEELQERGAIWDDEIDPDKARVMLESLRDEYNRLKNNTVKIGKIGKKWEMKHKQFLLGNKYNSTPNTEIIDGALYFEYKSSTSNKSTIMVLSDTENHGSNPVFIIKDSLGKVLKVVSNFNIYSSTSDFRKRNGLN